MPRIASLSSFNRPSRIREVNKKYFFALEGMKTEVNYIKKIIENKKINSKTFYFYRNKSNPESSNLLSITSTALDVIQGKKEAELMYESLVDIIYDASSKKEIIINKKKLKSKLESILSKHNKNLHDEIDFDSISDVLNEIQKSSLFNNLKDIVNEKLLISLIEEQSTFCKDIDTIVIIGDRDIGSFKDNQYDDVLIKTKENNITLIISNPCIEFWFLLHHTNAEEIDKTNWEKDDKSAQYVYDALKKYDSSFNKKFFNVDDYIKKTEIAIQNARKYCTSLEGLKNNIGTNMEDLYHLVDKMK